ncbi:hypothetical protein [Thauera sp.]|uniref:hypothetical protein n=1 Tax=Thauera sp. TaxID=1905334 RepID=UPI002A370F48|nr:hypothetical protein [Thauera sp.]MDX9885100.1 hypothetical protein [Thauera sp.]
MSTKSQNSRSGAISILPRVLNRLLRRLGYELVPHAASSKKAIEPPPMHAHPLTALVRSRSMGPSAFACPLDQIVMLNGFGFGPSGWHPFSAALEQFAADSISVFGDSVLRQFYTLWQPGDAAEAVAGFTHPPAVLRGAPPHGYHFTPWSTLSLNETIEEIRRYYAADYVEHHCPDLRLEVDGFKFHGPVSTELGRVELDRLIRVHRALGRLGYDRSHGDINVYILRRGSEFRFVCRGGVHRLAAMKALGHTSIPAQLRPPYLVDIQDLEHWPQVENGHWEAESAKRYFDHLFDFDARNWARIRGLAETARAPAHAGTLTQVTTQGGY